MLDAKLLSDYVFGKMKKKNVSWKSDYQYFFKAKKNNVIISFSLSNKYTLLKILLAFQMLTENVALPPREVS